MAKAKRLTFEYTRGWNDHAKLKPYNTDETDDWKDGWIGRENYKRALNKVLRF